MIRKLGKFLFALCLFAGLCATAHAQDTHVTTTGASVNVFTNKPSSQFSGAGPFVYILTTKPNQSVNFSVINSGASSETLSYQVFSTSSVTVANYSSNKSSWQAAQNWNITNGYNLTGALKSITISAASSITVTTPITQAVQIAFAISSASNNANPLTVNAVFTSNGAIPISTVQGSQSSGGSNIGINPVLICVKDTGNLCSIPTVGGGGNGLDLAVGNPAIDDGIHTQNTGPLGASTIPMVAPQLWNPALGAAAAFERPLSINKFHSVSATASGSTAVWTPGASFKFVVQCVGVEVTEDAKQAVAGDLTISLLDSATATGFSWTVFVPAASLTASGELFSSGTVCFSNGFKSATVNNILNVSLSSALTAGSVVVHAYGTESF